LQQSNGGEDLMGIHLKLLVAVALLASLTGCVSDIARNSDPATLTPASGTTAAYRLADDVSISLRSGYWSVALKKDWIWRDAGSIPQGRVYRPVDRPLMVSGEHLHEAYLVISENMAVGFYLTGEHAFVSANPPQSVNLKENGQ
jgi:hypothetical protein